MLVCLLYLWGLHDLLYGGGLLVKTTEESSGVGGNKGDEDESEGGHGSGWSEVGGRRICERMMLVIWRWRETWLACIRVPFGPRGSDVSGDETTGYYTWDKRPGNAAGKVFIYLRNCLTYLTVQSLSYSATRRLPGY